LWVIATAGEFLFHLWDHDDCLVGYCQATGQTHLFEPPGREIIKLLEQSPHSLEMLAAKLADLFESDHQGEIVKFIESTMLQLKEAGAVQVSPS
jgi:PqqD family protein of HPr-rel-A system